MPAWIFHGLDTALLAVMLLLVVRIAWPAKGPAGRSRTVWRALCRITDPPVALVAWITPRAVPHGLLTMFAVVWLLIVRFLLLAWLAGLGAAPPTLA